MAPTPAYRVLADELAGRIRSGEIPVGEKLPSITQLVDAGSTLGIARDALVWLAGQGWVEAQHGIGYVVVRMPPEPPAADRSWDEWRAAVERRLDALEGKPQNDPAPE